MADDSLTNDHERLYVIAKNAAIREWGLPAWRKLGSRIRRALIAEEVLQIAAAQDSDEVTAETVRRIVDFGFVQVMKEE